MIYDTSQGKKEKINKTVTENGAGESHMTRHIYIYKQHSLTHTHILTYANTHTHTHTHTNIHRHRTTTTVCESLRTQVFRSWLIQKVEPYISSSFKRMNCSRVSDMRR